MKKIFIIILSIAVLTAAVFFYFFKFSNSQDNSIANKKILQSSVTSIIGIAEYLPTGVQQWQNLNVGQILNEGDQIKTGASSSVEVIFYNHARVSLDSNTAVVINSMLAPDETNQNLKINLFLQVGRIWNRIVNLVDSNSSYEVETSEAVAAVRGTVFDMRARINGHTEVDVIKSKVEVTAKGSKKSVLVLENQSALVEASSTEPWADMIVVASSTLDLNDAWVVKNLNADIEFDKNINFKPVPVSEENRSPATVPADITTNVEKDLVESGSNSDGEKAVGSQTDVKDPTPAQPTQPTSPSSGNNAPTTIKPSLPQPANTVFPQAQPLPTDTDILSPNVTYFETDQTLDEATLKKVREVKLIIQTDYSTIKIGKTILLTPMFVNSDGTKTNPGQCWWSVLDEQIATMDNRNVVGQSIGETSIAVKCPHPTLPVNYYAALDIKVIAPTVGANALR